MKALLAAALPLLAALAPGQSADAGAHLPSQAAADAIREFAKTDGAFLAAALTKDGFDRADLATLVQYPTDEIVVVSLTGAQIRAAFERSLSLFPQGNGSFLQISGFEVSFSRSAAPGSRVLSVTAGGAKLDDGRTYSVAMPGNLGRGGLGYFKIWDKAKIARPFAGATLESVLRGKRFTDSSPRWSPQP